MKISQPIAISRATIVVVLGIGLPWLAAHFYHELSRHIPPYVSRAWVDALGWLAFIVTQWVVVGLLLKITGGSLRSGVIGSGRWLEADSLVKVLAILVLTGISLDYLWQLPWFSMFPDKLTDLSAPSSQNFSDEETLAVGPALTTTVLMLTAGPIVEEIFYRVLILRTLTAVMPVGWAIASSSLLFGLFHLGDPLAAVSFSAILSLVYLQTGSLLSCIALHIAYNCRIALSELLTVVFPDYWYRSYDTFRADAWWLHATILMVSTALVFDYARSRNILGDTGVAKQHGDISSRARD
jgi:membrane protease YdiL (CAAX protease family)